jgi:cell surface protein SprA
LAVAFQYTAAGRTYQVGEFSNDGVTPPKTLILKLLKSTVLDVRMPTWDLMMKNIYALNAYQLDREDFYMDILYMNDETGVPIPFLPDGNLSDTLLIGVMELDRLNTNNDPFPDGIFDFVPGTTIDQQRGRIIFPVVEPFGSNLYEKLDTEKARDRYVYQALYDSTRFRAQEQTQLNKFILRGQYKSASGSEISLGAFNIPQGSVTVTAGGRTLTENQDYTVDYSLGRVRIINEGVLNSGLADQVSFENNTLFNVQTKTVLRTNIDHKVNEHLNIGGTWLHLTERPLTQKVNIGDEPISNTIWGMNTNYSDEAPYLTRFVDALPFIETKEKSQLQFKGEFAHLIPDPLAVFALQVRKLPTSMISKVRRPPLTCAVLPLGTWPRPLPSRMGCSQRVRSTMTWPMGSTERNWPGILSIHPSTREGRACRIIFAMTLKSPPTSACVRSW